MWLFWAVVALFLIATWLTNIEVTNRFVNRALICILVLGLAGLSASRNNAKKLWIARVVFGMILVFVFFLDLRGDWKTQTIIYKNKHSSNRTIEFQLQDIGAFGYNRRTIDRITLFPFVSITRNVDQEDLQTIDLVTWDKVDIHLNEQGLKGG